MKSERTFWGLVFLTLFLTSCSRPSGEFVTTFEYYENPYIPFAKSAKTVDERTGKLIAKAELVRFSENNTLIVKETHYTYFGPIKIVSFTCESEFGFGGLKISETKIRGRKVFDVYNTWPTYTWPR